LLVLFREIAETVNANLNDQLECYTSERTKAGKRPTTFRLVGASRIDNPTLRARFDATAKRLKEAGRSAAELRVRRGFHGSHPKNLPLIAKNGLLRVGHALNPSKPVDDGWFGSTSKGVYVSCHADYALQYSNRLDPLEPGETARLIMFDVIAGRNLHIPKAQIGMQPTAGYDSHYSANRLE
jgi:hypothetical protein